MKLVFLFVAFPTLAAAVTFGTTDCGGPAATGGAGHTSSLENANYSFVVSNLVVDPTLTSISLETEAFYTFEVRAPSGIMYTDVFVRTQLEGNYLVEPLGTNIKFASGCEGNVTGLTSTDATPKSLVKGKFSVRDIGNFTIDVTVVQQDAKVAYTKYTFSVDEELPDVPTVTPKLVTTFPTASPTKKPPSGAPVAKIAIELVGTTTEAPAVATSPAMAPVVPVTTANGIADGVAVAVPVAVPAAVPAAVPVAAPAATPTAPVVEPVETEDAPKDPETKDPATKPDSSGRSSTTLFSLFALGAVAFFMA